MLDLGRLQSLSLALVHIGIGLSLLLAIIELIKKNGNRWFVLLALLGAVLQLRFLFSLTGFMLVQPWSTFGGATALAAFGPTMLFAGLKAASFAFEDRNYRRLLHYIPAIIILVSEIVFQLEAKNYKSAILQNITKGRFELDLFTLVNAGAGILGAGYMIYISMLFLKLSQDYKLRYRNHTKLLLLLPLVSLLLTGTGILVGNAWLYHMGGWVVTIFIGYVFLLKETAPGFFEALLNEVQAQRYAKTQLNGIDVTAVKIRISELMAGKKIYRNEELRLADLADELLIGTNKLSRIINEQYGKNFFEFINEFRIKEACQLLAADPKSSILAIAYQVGFNTKTTFNIQFSKQIGMSPTEYRKQNAIK